MTSNVIKKDDILTYRFMGEAGGVFARLGAPLPLSPQKIEDTEGNIDISFDPGKFVIFHHGQNVPRSNKLWGATLRYYRDDLAHSKLKNWTIVDLKRGVVSRHLSDDVLERTARNYYALGFVDGLEHELGSSFDYDAFVQPWANATKKESNVAAPIVAEFSPSRELAAFVARGRRLSDRNWQNLATTFANAFQNSVHDAQDFIASIFGGRRENDGKITDAEIDAAAAQLRHEVYSIIANLGRYFEKDLLDASEGKTQKSFWGTTHSKDQYEAIRPLSKNNRFTDQVQRVLLDNIPVDPYEIREFFDLLFGELSILAKSGQVGAPWSKLIVEKGDLALRIIPRKSLKRK